MSETRKLRITGSAEFVEAPMRADGKGGTPRFNLIGYTGQAVRQWWSDVPVVVDLAGMETDGDIAVMVDHVYDRDHAVGQADVVTNDGRQLAVSTAVIGDGEEVQKTVALARKGWRLQASIGADILDMVRVRNGETVTINGREFAGPFLHVKASRLYEVSLVLFGADNKTSAAIAAKAMLEGLDMPQGETTKPGDTVTASAEATAGVAAGSTPVVPGLDKAGKDGANTVEAGSASAAVLEAIKAQNATIERLNAELSALKGSVREGIRAERPSGPAIHAHGGDQATASVMQAALCLRGGLRGIEKHFDAQTVEAADKKNRKGYGLQECILEFANANGYTGSQRIRKENCREVLQYAFGFGVKASATHDISDVLSGAYGKQLLDGFFSVEPGWEKIARKRNVNDFKEVTGVRIVGGFEYEEVGNDGEIPSVDLTDEKRTVKAKTYGRLSSITRQDIINDDLDALADTPRHLGRGAGLKINTEVWTEFQTNNATYYAKRTAHADNAFDLDALGLAVTDWRKLKGPDNQPIGILPKLLILPPELEIPAAKIMGSDLLITGASITDGNKNPFQGRYELLVSSYLTSATTWWLGADVRDLPAMVIAFLDGIDRPTVETAEADFSKLAIQMRGFLDFGVAKGESKGVYRMATS